MKEIHWVVSCYIIVMAMAQMALFWLKMLYPQDISWAFATFPLSFSVLLIVAALGWLCVAFSHENWRYRKGIGGGD